jgi:hypothetical protein
VSVGLRRDLREWFKRTYPDRKLASCNQLFLSFSEGPLPPEPKKSIRSSQEQVESIMPSIKNFIVEAVTSAVQEGFQYQFSPWHTLSYLGTQTMNRVMRMGNFVALEAIDHGRAILTAREQKDVSQVENEHELIARFTPFLGEIAAELHLDIVNSEHFQWLSQPTESLSIQLKPDGFFTVKGLFQRKDEPNDKDSTRLLRDNGSNYCFGVPFGDLQDSVIIFEGKRKITDKALEKVVQYLQFLENPKGAILFDDNQFWLISCAPYLRNNDVNCIQHGLWTLPGSASHFYTFLKRMMSNWANLVIDAASKICLIIEEGGYLGRGATGRVFKCNYQGKQVALKVVNGKDNSLRLIQEFDSYKRLENIECVASVVTKPVPLLNDLGCAMCISPVGQAMSHLRPLSRNNIKRAFECLVTLHSAGVSHGDARIEKFDCCQHVRKMD